MDICFITDQPEVCSLLMERLSDSRHRCYIQEDWLEFERDIKNPSHKLQLILCDYQFIGSCLFNIYEVIRNTGNLIPLIFYNDPVPDDDSRVFHWINQNKTGLRMDEFPSHLIPVLEKLNEIIMDPAIRKHISLLQPAVPVYFKNSRVSTKNREFDLVTFRRRNRLSPVIFKLFKYMYENREKEFTMKELSKVLFKKCDNLLHRRNSVYSYISRLRRCLEKDRTIDADILRSGTGCYELIIY